MVGIYKFTNKITGESYIGQSTNIHKRYIGHKNHCDPSKKYYEDSLFHRNVAQYGFDNFEFTVLEECEKGKLNEREVYYIEHYGTLTPYGYNVCRGGNSSFPNGLKSVEDASEIKKLLRTTRLSNTEIGEMFGVTDQTISDINNGRIWNDKSDSYPIRQRHRFVCIKCGKKLNFKNQNSLCRDCYNERSKMFRPSKEDLYNDLRDSNFTKVGEKYGVTGNSVVKWCKGYGIPYHASYYRQLNSK